jgi:hypothetical protein
MRVEVTIDMTKQYDGMIEPKNKQTQAGHAHYHAWISFYGLPLKRTADLDRQRNVTKETTTVRRYENRRILT